MEIGGNIFNINNFTGEKKGIKQLPSVYIYIKISEEIQFLKKCLQNIYFGLQGLQNVIISRMENG